MHIAPILPILSQHWIDCVMNPQNKWLASKRAKLTPTQASGVFHTIHLMLTTSEPWYYLLHTHLSMEPGAPLPAVTRFPAQFDASDNRSSILPILDPRTSRSIANERDRLDKEKSKLTSQEANELKEKEKAETARQEKIRAAEAKEKKLADAVAEDEGRRTRLLNILHNEDLDRLRSESLTAVANERIHDLERIHLTDIHNADRHIKMMDQEAGELDTQMVQLNAKIAELEAKRAQLLEDKKSLDTYWLEEMDNVQQVAKEKLEIMLANHETAIDELTSNLHKDQALLANVRTSLVDLRRMETPLEASELQSQIQKINSMLTKLEQHAVDQTVLAEYVTKHFTSSTYFPSLPTIIEDSDEEALPRVALPELIRHDTIIAGLPDAPMVLDDMTAYINLAPKDREQVHRLLQTLTGKHHMSSQAVSDGSSSGQKRKIEPTKDDTDYEGDLSDEPLSKRRSRQVLAPEQGGSKDKGKGKAKAKGKGKQRDRKPRYSKIQPPPYVEYQVLQRSEEESEVYETGSDTDSEDQLED